jgi:hypothetical protein
VDQNNLKILKKYKFFLKKINFFKILLKKKTNNNLNVIIRSFICRSYEAVVVGFSGLTTTIQNIPKKVNEDQLTYTDQQSRGTLSFMDPPEP